MTQATRYSGSTCPRCSASHAVQPRTDDELHCLICGASFYLRNAAHGTARTQSAASEPATFSFAVEREVGALEDGGTEAPAPVPASARFGRSQKYAWDGQDALFAAYYRKASDRLGKAEEGLERTGT